MAHGAGPQVLVVRLPKTGPVMLSGDMVHLGYSWQNRIVPSFNFNVAQSGNYRTGIAFQHFYVLCIRHSFLSISTTTIKQMGYQVCSKVIKQTLWRC